MLARNSHHPLGEVDLIARLGRLLIFVEFKFRAYRDTGPYAGCLPSGGASARVLPDLSPAINIMALGVSGTIKISGALEPARNFGESVGREARGARRVLVERDAHGLTRWSANGSDCRY